MQTWSTATSADRPPPEFELLLLCARTKLDQVDATRIEKLLQQDLDWSGFVRQAIDHQVLPLVHQTLKGATQDRIPPEVMKELQQLSGAILRHNLFLLTKLLQAIDLLRAHEIPMIPYKGPVVAALAYGNIGLRQFSDIDILVSPSRYLEARDVLLENGYMLGRELGNEFALVHEVDGAHLDLHR
ncbi:MAG: nucleotidyltransferase domain-containing protein, partial [Pseudomonadota bacterium]